MKIILLPGLDGTGHLFEELMKQLPNDWDTTIYSYDHIDAESFINQAVEISTKINNDVFIIAESYSGRVAYELCQLLGARVKGVVFLASFISRPSQMSRLTKYIPSFLFRANILSRWALYLVGFSASGSRTRVNPVFESLGLANKAKLNSRLRNIASLHEAVSLIECPVTYIKPTIDLLVSNKAITHLESRCTTFKEVEISGGHFIAQSNPIACGKAIRDAFNTIQALLQETNCYD